MTDLALVIRPEHPGDRDAIERLHERAFGPGRFARTAYRLRERAPEAPELCVTALVGTLLVGSVKMTPVVVGAARELMLGPLAVEPVFEGRGIGAALIRRAMETGREAGYRLVILVGDLTYYARFGFAPVPPGRLVMPGPVDPARLLAAELAEGARAAAAGRVRPVRV